jgi:hypothetical protein
MAYIPFLHNAYFTAKVGIGTDSPGAVLEVRASASSPFGALRLSTSSTKYWQFNTIYNNTDPDLFIAPNGGAATMTLQSSGNVGIGTTLPPQKLAVIGNISLGNYNGSDFSRSIGINDSSGAYGNGSSYIKFNELSGSGTSGTTKGAAIEFYNHLYAGNTNQTMIIQADGKVGIGTSSPLTKLHAEGVVTIKGSGTGTSGSLAIQDNYTATDHLGNIGWNRSAGGPYLSYGLKQDGSADWKSTFGNFSGMRTYMKLDNDEMSLAWAPAQTTAVGTVVTGLLERFKFKLDSGSLQLNAYDGTNKTGTPTYLLGTDASGNIVKTLPQGSGTAGPYLPLAGGTLTGPLIVDTAGGAEKMTFNNEFNTAPIADSFSGNTSKSYISFGVVAGSNDPGFIMHESSATETNEGVLHLCPSDDNATNDYVSIHGSNDPDVINLHTSGLIETVNLQMQLKSGLNAVYINDDLQVANGGSFGGTGIFTGGGNTLMLKKGTGNPAIAFAGTATDPEASALIEGIAGGGLKFYTSNGGTIGTPAWSSKLTIAAGGTATFTGSVVTPTVITDNVVAKTSSGNITFKNNSGSTIAQFYDDLSSTFTGTVTAADLLTVNGDGHLFLGADGETPKIDMMYDDHASGVVWDTRIFIGKTDDLPSGSSAPTYTVAGGYGTQYQANSDGAFFGIIPYATGNYRPVINWGDDAADTPFSFQFNGTNIVNISYAGTVSAPIFSGDHQGTINTATTAFTQANTTNNTTVATTAFVKNLISEIPAGLAFEGTWDARTVAEGGAGTPPSASPLNGQFWIVSVDGSQSLSGITDWKVGDWAIYVDNGAGTDGWQKVDNSSVLDGEGTGQTIPLWSGSGNSNTLTDSVLTQQSDDEVSILSTTATTGQNGKLTIYSYDDGDTDVKNLQLTVNNGGDANITNSGPYLNLTALNYIKSNNVHIFNEDMFMYFGKYIRFLDATSPQNTWNRTLGVSASDVVQVGGIDGYNTGKGQLELFSNNVQAMYIDDNQMVGIGRVPDNQNVLDIQNDNTAGSFTTHRNTTGFALNRTYGDYGNDGTTVEYQERIGVDGNNSSIGNFSNHNLGIRTNNQDRITILAGGNVGINSTSPPSLLDVQPTTANRKVTRIANDVMSTYFYNTQADAVLAWTCGSYYQAEVVITANQTNGGTTANLYIRGIWSNNHTSHHWDELEHIGSLPGSTITMSV